MQVGFQNAGRLSGIFIKTPRLRYKVKAEAESKNKLRSIDQTNRLD